VLGIDGRGGFLRDIGRLPVAVGDADYDPDTGNFLQLSELWLQGDFPDYQMDSPSGDQEVRLSAGWRGPYLNLGINRNKLSDGFGKVFRLWQADTTVSNHGEPIEIVVSAGANDEIDETDIGMDQVVAVFFETIENSVAPGYPPQNENRWQTPVQVNLIRDDGEEFNKDDDDGRYLIIRAYGPVNGAPGTSNQGTIDLNTVTTAEYRDVEGAQALAISMLVPHGSKVFRAYQLAAEPDKEDLIVGPSPTTSPPPGSHTASRKSPATHVVIDRFTSGPITLTLY